MATPVRLDRRITFQRPTETQCAYGGVATTWADVATVWAAVKFPGVKSGETYIADQQVVMTNTVFIVRYRDNFTAKDRIEFKDEYYDILSIGEFRDRNRYLRIEALKRSTDNNG